MKDSDTLSEGI